MEIFSKYTLYMCVFVRTFMLKKIMLRFLLTTCCLGTVFFMPGQGLITEKGVERVFMLQHKEKQTISLVCFCWK